MIEQTRVGIAIKIIIVHNLCLYSIFVYFLNSYSINQLANNIQINGKINNNL
jgi:hypothetical protein